MLQFFDTAFRASPHQNMLFSPWGIRQCFGMIAAGAGTEGKTEILKKLGLDQISAVRQIAARQSLSHSNVQFNSFNALFLDSCYTLQPGFIRQCSLFYGGKLYQFDRKRKGECVRYLNQIVQRESRNLFKDVFSGQILEGDPALVLLNVLYFKAQWELPFMPHKTVSDTFQVPGSPPYKVDMMSAEWKIPYYNDGKICGITLNYSDPRFKLLLLMPVKSSDPLETVTASLAEKGLDTFLQNSSSQYKTRLKVPRLKLEHRLELIPLFRKNGIQKIFDRSCGALNAMVKDHALFVSHAEQFIKLNLDESGTEVAAVTYAGVETMSLRPENEKINEFYVNRSFVLTLFDTQTGVVLLTGAILHP